MLGKGLHKPVEPTQTMDEAEREYRTVILAGLLHDIGKCFERGDFGAVKVTGKHPQVGADYVRACHSYFDRCVDAMLLHTPVQRHHEGRQFPDALRVEP